MAKITLPDGKIVSVADGLPALQVVEQIGSGLAKAALAVKINGKLADLTTPLNGELTLQVLTARDPEGLEILRHSCAHIMAEAVCRLWPNTKLVYGPTVADGFYYDIDLDTPIRPEDFEKIEQEMKKIIQSDQPFVRIEMTREQALQKMADDPYKLDNIHRASGDVISFYRHGDSAFEDLCRGPHIPRTSRIDPRAFKIMSVAGAYWHGDANQKMLQRVYGTVWPSKKELDSYLERMEEARKRDHRLIGRQMDLFSFHEEGPGFAFLHPKGMIIWNEIIDFWRGLHKKYKYVEVKTPIILNESLWHRSGHWDHYKENMYFTTVDGVNYAIKPMNCPGGLLIYNSRKHSYREFPMRVAELGLVHRYEASGQMHGLVRVRQFTQDDAHIFCTPEQIESEIIGVINLVEEIYSTFGFEDYHIELSTKPEKHIGSDEIWELATNALAGALKHKGLAYQINEGDGAFYGPKIDFHISDCLGRSWQLGTIQLDFSMPQRFNLVYSDRDNTEKTPVMIHRAILGSLERFLGILIEHYGGNFPLWLAPEQVRILPISEKTNDYAGDVLKRLEEKGLRCSADLTDDKIGAKIAKAHADRVPYMVVVGPREQETGTLNIRLRQSKEGSSMGLDAFLNLLQEKIRSRSLSLSL
ncbi:MAG TPA: threonine--tRNA ligase [Anaerohalosphaeraceae bacterium]|nr:threonine--tRNA ligase [Anaerohalosphaeraceae bacterium]HQG06918.1 threonine--tRNA ligase [Anaerohalosphaeraceae bacterium]HQI08318.1 threonine--tRNA ligase [Anaerohalosphaeraceae bacterium]HQJ68649.1 threonine--tRNA ligase [Anaerohalosphaeraceae bacterium]